MGKQGIIAGAVFLLALPAIAEELAGTDIAYVEQSDCDAIAVHLPGGADYVPGVAADGSRVAPADLGGGYQYRTRPVYEFDAVMDPLVRRNPAFSSATRLNLVRIAIDMETGRVTMDGQDASGLDHALAEACARLHHKPVK